MTWTYQTPLVRGWARWPRPSGATSVHDSRVHRRRLPALWGPALVLLVCAAAASGCGGESQAQRLSPRSIAAEVGAHYGDPHAAVVVARPDQTEADDEPMYLMTISGHMRKDGVLASRLTFSALANRFYVWDICAFDSLGRQVWSEPDWGRAPPRLPRHVAEDPAHPPGPPPPGEGSQG